MFYQKIKDNMNQGQNRRYNHVLLGNNFRMTDVSASIGIIQLKKLNSCLYKKQKIALNYINILKIFQN